MKRILFIYCLFIFNALSCADKIQSLIQRNVTDYLDETFIRVEESGVDIYSYSIQLPVIEEALRLIEQYDPDDSILPKPIIDNALQWIQEYKKFAKNYRKEFYSQKEFFMAHFKLEMAFSILYPHYEIKDFLTYTTRMDEITGPYLDFIYETMGMDDPLQYLYDQKINLYEAFPLVRGFGFDPDGPDFYNHLIITKQETFFETIELAYEEMLKKRYRPLFIWKSFGHRAQLKALSHGFILHQLTTQKIGYDGSKNRIPVGMMIHDTLHVSQMPKYNPKFRKYFEDIDAYIQTLDNGELRYHLYLYLDYLAHEGNLIELKPSHILKALKIEDIEKTLKYRIETDTFGDKKRFKHHLFEEAKGVLRNYNKRLLK